MDQAAQKIGIFVSKVLKVHLDIQSEFIMTMFIFSHYSKDFSSLPFSRYFFVLQGV